MNELGELNGPLASGKSEGVTVAVSIQIDGMEACEPFQRGGKQGAVETPDSFNVYLEEALH